MQLNKIIFFIILYSTIIYCFADICSSCKFDNSSDDRYCVNCGGKLRDATEAEQKEIQQNIDAIKKRDEENKKQLAEQKKNLKEKFPLGKPDDLEYELYKARQENKLIVGMNKDDVIKLVGSPSDIEHKYDNKMEIWKYKKTKVLYANQTINQSAGAGIKDKFGNVSVALSENYINNSVPVPVGEKLEAIFYFLTIDSYYPYPILVRWEFFN